MTNDRSTGRDNAGNRPQKPVRRDLGWKATSTPLGGEIAPHGPIFPSRSPVTDNGRITSAVQSAISVAERFNIAEAHDARQAALLAMDVLDRFADGRGPLTKGDAGKMVGTVRRLLTAHGEERARVDELEAQLAEARDEATGLAHDRTAAEAAADTLTRQLADVTTDRDALRLERDQARSRAEEWANEAGKARKEREEFRASGFVLEDNLAQVTGQLGTATAQLADMTAERDAAAENARRERDRRDPELSANWRNAIGWQIPADKADDPVTLAAFAWADRTSVGRGSGAFGYFVRAFVAGYGRAESERPRCRVVTSPRFYGFEEQRAAADALDKHTHDLGFHMREMHRLELVETVAEALGMRRT